MRLPSRALLRLLAAPALVLLLASCSGGDDGDPAPAACPAPPGGTAGPSITSFEADGPALLPGEARRLTACFSGGEGRVEPGGLPVTPGVPVSVGPFASGMTFTLVVSDGVREVQRDLGLPLRYRGRLRRIGALAEARAFHAAVALADGRVLVAGGTGGGNSSRFTAELIDPVTGAVTPAGSLLNARSRMPGVRLPDGRVALLPGIPNAQQEAVRQVEVWSPATNTWSELGQLEGPRPDGVAQPLPNGLWLVTGGVPTRDLGAELFDPATGRSRRLDPGPLAPNRVGHSATYTSAARVLLVGGNLGAAGPVAELYDPDTETFEPTPGEPLAWRTLHVAAYLAAEGRVLLAGGEDREGALLASAELYDVDTGTFAPAGGPLVQARSGAAGVVLASGEVLVAGGSAGRDAGNRPLSRDTLELYDGSAFRLLEARLPGPLQGLSLTLLPDARVLVVGGTPDEFAHSADILVFD